MSWSCLTQQQIFSTRCWIPRTSWKYLPNQLTSGTQQLIWMTCRSLASVTGSGPGDSRNRHWSVTQSKLWLEAGSHWNHRQAFQVCFPDQQHGQPLGACEKYKFSGLSPDVLNQMFVFQQALQMIPMHTKDRELLLGSCLQKGSFKEVNEYTSWDCFGLQETESGPWWSI